MTLNFGGAEIHYAVAGEGEATVLLHGFLESSKIWEEFLPEFSQYGKFITIDLPGHGKSGCVGEIHSMELMAEAVQNVLTESGVKKGNFIGHSMGGYVALAFLEKWPEKMNDLMLLNSTPQEDSGEKRKIRERSIEVAQKNKKAYINMAISNLLPPENNKKFAKEVGRLKEEANKFPTKGITAALEGMKIRTERTDVLKRFTGDKIIVAGKKDPVMDFLKIKALANECGCRFFAFSGGHLGYLENQKEFRKLCISSNK